MIRLSLCAAAFMMPGVVAADEFTDVVESALSAYAEGDVAGAREELDYAMKLLTALKAESLATFLPEAPAGWTKTEVDADAGGSGAAMALFGGGTVAAATYEGNGVDFTLTLLANSPMVSGIAAMVSGLGAVGGGKTQRIQRTQFMINDGEIQGVVGERVLLTASGSAAPEDVLAIIETMDLRALGAF